LGEYSNILFMSSLLSLFFWGGWLPIFSWIWIFGSSITGISWIYIPNTFWFGLKITFHFFIFVWIRASFPRYRYDQLMKLGWKVLMPLSVVFVYFVSFILLNFFYML
jgi:NADH-quinone oxidoreductase subunit H